MPMKSLTRRWNLSWGYCRHFNNSAFVSSAMSQHRGIVLVHFNTV